MAESRTKHRWTFGRILLYGVHWIIILNFLIQMGYAAYMVFWVFAPEGTGPLLDRARDVDFELMTTRRLYAIEFWIATAGLAIYLALTEIGPRLKKHRS